MNKLFTGSVSRSSIFPATLLLAFFLCLTNVHATQVPCTSANSQTGTITPDCANCTITDAAKAIDNQVETASMLNSGLSTLGYVQQILKFGTSGEAGDSIRVMLSFSLVVPDISWASHVSIATLNNNTYNNDRTSIDDPKFSIRYSIPSLPDPVPQYVLVSFAATQSFNKVEVRITSKSFAKLQWVNVHYANRETTPPVVEDDEITICSGQKATLKAVAPAGAFFRWYQVPQGGSVIYVGTTFTTPALTTSTTYYLESSKNGCISPYRAPVHVNVLPILEIPQVNSPTICSGEQATLIANGPEGLAYQWFDQPLGGSPIGNESTFTTPPLFENTAYYVQSLSRSGCTNPFRGKANVTVEVYDQQVVQWNEVYGGSKKDFIRDGVPTADGGYFLVGYAESKNGTVSNITKVGNSWVLKIDANGVKQWDKSYIGSTFVKVLSVPGGYLLAEYGDDFRIVKMDLSGTVIWAKEYGGKKDDIISTLIATPDNGFLLGGTTESFSNDGSVTAGTHGLRDFWIVKIDAAGNKLWDKTYGGSKHDELSGLLSTSDGGYFLSGITYSNNGDVAGNHGMRDIWIVKVNAAGNKLWTKTYGGSADEVSSPHIELIPTADNNYLLLGGTQSDDGDIPPPGSFVAFEFWLVKLNPSGTIIWSKTYGNDAEEFGGQVLKTADGGYLLAGSTTFGEGLNILLIKTDVSGNESWRQTFSGNYPDNFLAAVNLPDSYLIISESESDDGDVHPSPIQATGHNVNAWVMKFKESDCPETSTALRSADIQVADPEDVKKTLVAEHKLIYPNPFTSQINIEIESANDVQMVVELFNSSGVKIKLIETVSEIVAGKQNVVLDGANLDPGIYLCKVSVDGKVYVQKLIKN